ncbi:hypothetical protein LBMAG42_13670 [Deltaproteobacteria bacterium]|nr:hypothetical protein LBMAG42_13670 [Deltaproteobacteria bacterium]
MRVLPFCLVLVACETTPPDTGDTGHTGDTNDTAETGDTADTADTADTGDTGDTADTGDTGGPADLGFDLDGGWAGSTLTLTWLDASTLGTDSVVFGDVMFSADAGADPLLVSAGTPPASELLEADPEQAPGMMVAIYVPALHVDADGDGLLSGEETYVGAGATWPIYVTGVIPAQYTAMGVVDGWNAMYVFSGDEGPEFSDPMTIPLAANVAVNEELTLGGSFADDPDGMGLVVIPGTAFEGGGVDSWLYDGPLAAAWSIPLSGEPPAEHFSAMEGVGWAAMELPVAYIDEGSGSFGEGDIPTNAACFGGVPVGAIWFPGPTDLMVALQFGMTGMGSGWVAMTTGDVGGGTVLTEAEAASLSIDATCTLGGP